MNTDVKTRKSARCEIAWRALTIFLPAIALTIAVTTVILVISNRAEMKITRSHAWHSVDIQAENIDNDIQQISYELAHILNHNEMIELWTDDGIIVPEVLSKLRKEFLNILLYRKVYDQVRLIDENGMETIRVNFNRGQPEIVLPEKLQNKKERYYFNAAFKLQQGEVFVSPLDLNIEYGKIELPLKPMIRFATPVFDLHGKKRGIVLLNYFGAKLLNHLVHEPNAFKNSQTILLNADGYWLKGPNPADEWGFMYEDRKDRVFANVYPEEWERINSEESCQFETSQGMFTCRTVYPQLAGQKFYTNSSKSLVPSNTQIESKAYHWKIISFLPSDVLYAAQNNRCIVAALVVGFLTIASAIVAWQAAFNTVKRRQIKEHLAATLNSIGDAVITTDMDKNVLAMNPVAEKLTAWTIEDAMGKPVTEVLNIVNSRNRQAAANPVAKVIETGKVIELDNPALLLSKDGSEYQISNSAAPIQDATGNTTGVVMIFRDVTEDYHIHEALRQSERFLQSVFRAAPSGIGVVKNRVLTEINRRVCEMTGYSKEELVGQNTRMLYPDDDDYEYVRHEKCRQIPEQGKGSVETRWQCKDGRIIDVLLSSTPIDDNKQLSQAMTFAALDITNRKKIQENLKISEARYRALYKYTPLPYQSLDENGCLIDVNPAWLQTLGYEREAVIGKPFSEFLHPDWKQHFKKRFPEFKCVGYVNDAQFRITHKKGHYLDISFEGRAGYRSDGSFLQSYCVFQDITERKKTEKTLQRLMSAVEHTGDSIVIIDDKAKIQYVNPAFRRTAGYTNTEVIGQNWRILKSGEHDNAFHEQLQATLKRGETWRGRLINKKKDGSFFTEDTSISPVLDERGNVSNFVAVKRDITDKLNYKKKLRQAQKMEAVGTLAGGIAHDFNNILFPIIGMAEMLIEDLPENSVERKNLMEIMTAGKRGAGLVKQILAFSRQSEGEKIPVRIQQILKEVVKMVRSSIPANITISHHIQQNCGLVMADPSQIHQIAMNLITNAFHAVEHSNGKIFIQLKEIVIEPEELTVKNLETGPHALLTISDTGCGIDPDDMDKIFEPYFTTKKQGKGTGIGLSTVYSIVKAFNGDIQVDSELEAGTTFNVYLPLLASDSNAVSVEPARDYELGTERILLVDDEEAITRLVKQMLERLGYQVTSQNNCLEALEAFKVKPNGFDLVIADMTMPNMTGDQLARELLSVRADIPIIICTGFSDRIDQSKAKAIGIKGFMTKPVELSEMAQMIRRVLDKSSRIVNQKPTK